jgi:hypothetical protein
LTPRDFVYWLQGFFEIAGQDATMTPDQLAMVRRHLDTVFEHEAAQNDPVAQRTLDEAHNPPGSKPSDRDGFDVAVERLSRDLHRSHVRPMVYC